MERLDGAKDRMLEWWFIFSHTGEIEDARMLVESIKEYDNLLCSEEELGL